MIKEKVQKLEEVKIQLKKEFVGLDSIIDQIINSVSTWYTTPEIIVRPVVISIWGMTGTGKSSVVRRLVELLGIGGDTMFFDCGKCISDRVDIISDIQDSFGQNSEELEGLGGKMFGSPVFVFDEFQYARTIDEERKEEVSPSLRPIWSILDNGYLYVTDRYDWSYTKFCEFVDDLDGTSKLYPDMKITGGKIMNRDDVRLILEELGLLYYSGRDVFDLDKGEAYPYYPTSAKDEDGSENDPYRPLPLLNQETTRYLFKRLNRRSQGSSKTFFKELQKVTTLRDYYEILRQESVLDRGGKYVDCSKSLVFVIGNLDEAFFVSDDLNPDIDPDVFYDMTRRVGISDIKEALLKRYRPEQVARLGNNMIKYPTLRGKDFRKIIDLEVERILGSLKEITPGVEIEVSQEMKDLLYSEGVFPTQGVRPIFSTVGSLLTPFLSLALVEREDDTKITIGIEDGIKDFRRSQVNIEIKFHGSERTKKYPMTLQLGEARDPKKRKKRYISSVHEAGHAVLYAWRTGEVPTNIVSVSTDHGGFCSTYNKETQGEIKCRKEIDDSVMISLAGYLAEEVVYSDRPDMRLMGSSSDLAEMWEEFSENCYRVGYFEPVLFSSRETEKGPANQIPGGENPERLMVKYYNGQVFLPEVRMYLDEAMRQRFSELLEETKGILETEKPLLKKVALELGETGYLSGERFLELLEGYGTVIHKGMMEAVRIENSPSYYKDILMKEED